MGSVIIYPITSDSWPIYFHKFDSKTLHRSMRPFSQFSEIVNAEFLNNVDIKIQLPLRMSLASTEFWRILAGRELLLSARDKRKNIKTRLNRYKQIKTVSEITSFQRKPCSHLMKSAPYQPPFYKTVPSAYLSHFTSFFLTIQGYHYIINIILPNDFSTPSRDDELT